MLHLSTVGGASCICVYVFALAQVEFKCLVLLLLLFFKTKSKSSNIKNGVKKIYDIFMTKNDISLFKRPL